MFLDAYTAGEVFCNGGELNYPKVDKEFDRDGHERFDAILVQLSQLSSSVSIISIMNSTLPVFYLPICVII